MNVLTGSAISSLFHAPGHSSKAKANCGIGACRLLVRACETESHHYYALLFFCHYSSFLKLFSSFARNSIIILLRWKSVWLMKVQNFPNLMFRYSLDTFRKYAVQTQGFSTSSSARDLLISRAILCSTTHTAVSVTTRTTYKINSLHRLHAFFQIRKRSYFSQASRFLSYVSFFLPSKLKQTTYIV